MTEREIFVAALQMGDPDQRRAYLDEVCSQQPEIRKNVDELLQLYQNAGSFMANPAATGAFLDNNQLTVPHESTGTSIGPYKLLELIGEGGMGTVWMAQQSEPVKRLVALKLIKPGMDSKQVLARFEAERQALALMDHPNIAKVHDAGTTPDGRPYFVMELVKGVPITKYCDDNRLTPKQRLQLFVPVCQAIQHAHQKGIIHRDIKPSNVLIALYDDRPVPKVIDFGIAKATGQQLTEETLHTGFGAVVGTVEYMSPEQASFNQLDVDTRSDIYSLGVLLYELLTGSPPFTRQDLEHVGVMEMLRVIREQEPSKPSTKLSSSHALPSLSANRGTDASRLPKLVRGELDWIVMKALEKDRNRRYETANGFAADLQRFLSDEPVHACPPSAVYRLRKFARRNRTGVLLSASLALLAATVLVGGWLYGLATRETERKRQESEHAQRITEAHEKIPLIQAAIRQVQHRKAFDLLKEIEPLIPDHPNLTELWEQCSLNCALNSVPSGADIWLRPYDQPDASWQFVIQTTERASTVRVPRGEYLWRATKTGYREVTGLRPPQSISFTLDPTDAIPKEMVRVQAGRPNQPGMAFSAVFQQVELPAFLIDRYEVTNAQFDQFVKAGGYDQPEFWQDLPLIDADGKATTWEKVKPHLVDQTGRAGPTTWRNGAFQPGEENHPVRGVSWYEAMAYARFSGKSLPTIYHWAQASQVELSVVLAGNDFITQSNFGAQVKSVQSLSDHGLHGTYGTIGNVKEWCVNDTGIGQRYLLGGGCGEPIYMPLTLDSSSPLRRDEFFGFRCVKFFDDQKGPAAAWATISRIPWPAPLKREDLMDAAMFRLVVQDRFTYDHKAPLDVSSEQIDEGAWIHVIAQINTAYRDAKGRPERMTLHLYLPKGIDAQKGYQTVVYLPGGDAHMLPRIRPLTEEYGLDALVRSGRAVLRPIYQGTYERRYESFNADEKTWEERRICVGQDLMRGIDYLQQRGDINMEQVGFHGFSWGAEEAGSLVAVESRIRAAVFEAGGLSNDPLRKDRAILEWRHCLPQIQVPVLMLNGQVDPIYPVKESQEPMFKLLGCPIKEHYVHPNGHHMLPPAIKFVHMLRWYDQHLGIPARTGQQPKQLSAAGIRTNDRQIGFVTK